MDLKEVLSTDMPKSKAKGFMFRAYVNVNHAGNSITEKSRTGFLIYLNSYLTYWLSKEQSFVCSSFGSKFMAMMHCTEYVYRLQFKLQMVDHFSFLKKKSNSIMFYFA